MRKSINYRNGVPAHWPFLWFSSGPTHTGLCLSCTGGPWTWCRTQVGSQDRGVKGEKHLPQPVCPTDFYAAQEIICFLGSKYTLPTSVQVFMHQYPRVFLCNAALNPFIPQSVLILGITLGFVDFHEVHIGLQSCQGPSIWYTFPQLPKLQY